jgi:hypothetical protein
MPPTALQRQLLPMPHDIPSRDHSTDFLQPRLNGRDMVRRKLLVKQTGKSRPDTADDYVIYVTTKFTATGRFFGELLLVRTTDARKRYPFDGASPIGPFPTVDDARAAATAHGVSLIEADLRNPEP